MEYRILDDQRVELDPRPFPPERVLAEMARLAYDQAACPLPKFIQPVEVHPSLVDFRALVTDEGVDLEFLNGRFCGLRVKRRGGMLILDAGLLREVHGSVEGFLRLLDLRLMGGA
ncbi:MAG: hypothetical protein JRH05_09650 [Deltaproteobacteria bacterium]|nr:hypothetical protein [Deltaproteobacteria bacterium]MBW2102922.1 hypothetical protein [Deltaproteobacteria bacterium]